MSIIRTIMISVIIFSTLLSLSVLAAAGSETSPFSDIEISRWSFPWIVDCYQQGILKGYPNGEFRPEQYVTKAEVIQSLYNLYRDRIPKVIDLTSPIRDVSEDDWYYKSAVWGMERELCHVGYGPGGDMFGVWAYSFGPDGPAQRGNVAVMALGRIADAIGIVLPEMEDRATFHGGIDAADLASFPDADHYYLKDRDGNLAERRDLAPYITRYIYGLADLGIVHGFEDGKFRPENPVTREQWAKLLSAFVEKAAELAP